MSEPAAYKLGPDRMDVAVRLKSGAWMRLANKHTLTRAEVEEWRDLVPVEDYEREQTNWAESLDAAWADVRNARAEAEKTIEQAAKMGFTESPSPERQRTMLLDQFGQHPDGLTIKEAAEKAGLIGVVTYTSRFATDLIQTGCLAVRMEDLGNGIGSVVAKRGRAKVYVATTEGYRRLRAGSAG